MTTRKLKHELLQKWVDENGKGSREKLALEMKCSSSLVQKLCTGNYPCSLSISKVDMICRITGYKMDDLFPVVENEKEAS